MSSALDVV